MAREGATVKSGRGVQDGDLAVEDLAAVVAGRAHPLDLLLHRRDNLVVARQREEPAVGGEQQRDAVVGQQRGGVSLASAAGRKRVEVLTKPPAHVAAVHGHGPYYRRAATASARRVVARPNPFSASSKVTICCG
jgi:hypothetical protein